MKKKSPLGRVGTYYMDGFAFDVEVVRNLDGASFHWPSTDKSTLSRPVLRIGYPCERHEATKHVLHELIEASAMHHRCLFEPTTWLTNCSCGKHVLHMDHAQFTEICVGVGDVLTYLLPELDRRMRE